jgi:hypothetical protein
VTTPFAAHALASEKISQNLDREPNMLIAQYGRDQNRDDRYRPNHNRDRQFSVYYRNRGDRRWNFGGYHDNRRDAQRAANRLERRGYRTYVEVSRRVYDGMNA